jgi:hypothetical protein
MGSSRPKNLILEKKVIFMRHSTHFELAAAWSPLGARFREMLGRYGWFSLGLVATWLLLWGLTVVCVQRGAFHLDETGLHLSSETALGSLLITSTLIVLFIHWSAPWQIFCEGSFQMTTGPRATQVWMATLPRSDRWLAAFPMIVGAGWIAGWLAVWRYTVFAALPLPPMSGGAWIFAGGVMVAGLYLAQAVEWALARRGGLRLTGGLVAMGLHGTALGLVPSTPAPHQWALLGLGFILTALAALWARGRERHGSRRTHPMPRWMERTTERVMPGLSDAVASCRGVAWWAEWRRLGVVQILFLLPALVGVMAWSGPAPTERLLILLVMIAGWAIFVSPSLHTEALTGRGGWGTLSATLPRRTEWFAEQKFRLIVTVWLVALGLGLLSFAASWALHGAASLRLNLPPVFAWMGCVGILSVLCGSGVATLSGRAGDAGNGILINGIGVILASCGLLLFIYVPVPIQHSVLWSVVGIKLALACFLGRTGGLTTRRAVALWLGMVGLGAALWLWTMRSIGWADNDLVGLGLLLPGVMLASPLNRLIGLAHALRLNRQG